MDASTVMFVTGWLMALAVWLASLSAILRDYDAHQDPPDPLLSRIIGLILLGISTAWVAAWLMS